MMRTIESILGVALLVSAMIFVIAIIPHASNKTEDYSKVQLVNIGRDALDLLEITPITNVIPNYYGNVCRRYNLTADKIYIPSGTAVNFTVKYADGDYELVYKSMAIEETNLNTGDMVTRNFTGPNYTWNFQSTDVDEYNFRVYDIGFGENCSTISNSLTIKVGHYFLVTDINGIYDTGTVNGTVYYTNWSGRSNINVQIFYCQGNGYPCSGNQLKVIANNYTDNGGNFSITWPNGQNTGTFYVRAIDNSSLSSNVHQLIFSSKNNGGLLCCNSIISETDSVTLIVVNFTFTQGNINNLAINGITWNKWSNPTKCPLCLNEVNMTWYNDTSVTLVFYTSGNYTIQVMDCKNGNCASPKTNAVKIIVNPISTDCLFTDCAACSSRFNMTSNIKDFFKFIPPNINFNLYLISPNGSVCWDCSLLDPNPMINGYPTDEAVTVNKIFNISSPSSKLKEIRMVLWYK